MSVRRGERWIGCANQGLLERETERLKKAVAELTLDKQIVEEASGSEHGHRQVGQRVWSGTVIAGSPNCWGPRDWRVNAKRVQRIVTGRA